MYKYADILHNYIQISQTIEFISQEPTSKTLINIKLCLTISPP